MGLISNSLQLNEILDPGLAGAPQYLHIFSQQSPSPSQPFIEWSQEGGEPGLGGEERREECFMTVSGDQGGKQTITQLQLPCSPARLHSWCVPASQPASLSLSGTVITHQSPVTSQLSSILSYFNYLIVCLLVSPGGGESGLGNPTDKFTLKYLVCCQVFGLTKYTQKYEVVKIQKCFSG